MVSGEAEFPSAGEASAAPAAEAAAAELEALRAALQAAQAQAGENHELYLRARAETENVRRRAADDVSKAHKFAIESFAEALVPVSDSLEKALAESGADAQLLRAGVEITLRQLRAAFERGRLTAIDPLGEKFDPHRHQAISAVPGDGQVPPNHVLAVLQKGWMIADRVLRPALVTVVQGS
jgi:molecular chaperone GrpE